MSPFRFRTQLAVVVAMLCAGLQSLQAQPSSSAGGEKAAEKGAGHVVIERVAVTLKDPSHYQIPLQLRASRSMTVRATAAGTVATIAVKPGETARNQSELLRLDSQIQQLHFQRASSEFKIAQLQLSIAPTGTEKEIADNRLSIARNNLDIAQLQLDRLISKSPYDATVFRVHVSEGEYVTAGLPLMDIADTSQLEVEVPVERGTVKAGDPLELNVEDKTVTGKVTAILPPGDAFVPLRDLFVSVASARVVFDNASGALQPGQAVFSKMIPRHPVVEAPNSALLNTPEGTRKVQVIRDGFVRDLPVDLLGAVGELHSYVSARFAAGDELIVRSSETLLDGTWVRPQLEVLKGSSAQQPEQRAPATVRPDPGF